MFGSRLLQRNRHSGQRSKLEQGQEGRISPASHVPLSPRKARIYK